MQPLVSAIVLNYRTGRDAWKCVQALLNQTIADRIEILIVDNHSDDDSIGYLRNRSRGHANIRILEVARNSGYGQGNDLGIRHARGEYILIINPDNELEPTGLERLVAAMEKDPSIGILAPKLVHEDGSIRDSFRTFPTMADLFIKRTPFLRALFPARMKRYLQHDQNASLTRDVDWVAGACLLMHRSFYGELGGFDPRFFLFFEDTDLCRRCRQLGKKIIYFPRAQAADRKQRLRR
jgi:GT2 family glycosyltransferase